MRYSFTLPYGSGKITVHADTIEELHFEVAYVRKLHDAAELGIGTYEAIPHAYKTKDGNTYVGFVRPDDAFVKFGKQKNPEDPARPYYAYKEGYEKNGKMKYQGYQYVIEGEVEPAPPLMQEKPQTNSVQKKQVEQTEEEEEGPRIGAEQAGELWDLAKSSGFTKDGFARFFEEKGLSKSIFLLEKDFPEARRIFASPMFAPRYNLCLTDVDLREKPNSNTFKTLQARFTELYKKVGKDIGDDLDTFRHKIIANVTRGRTSSSQEICATEAKSIISAINAQLKKYEPEV